MKGVKYFFTIALFLFLFFAKTTPAFADCYCTTVVLPDGSKDCQLNANTACPAGNQPYCQTNADGACNHGIFDGGSCICKPPGYLPPNGDNTDCKCGGNHTVTENNCPNDTVATCRGGPSDSCYCSGLSSQNYFCGDGVSVNTALGCIPAEMGAFMEWLLPKFFSIAGGIAFLLMVYGFILMSTSGGDPKKVEGAKETITSAITGLLLCIFALFLLRLIAVDILHIPGINK